MNSYDIVTLIFIFWFALSAVWLGRKVFKPKLQLAEPVAVQPSSLHKPEHYTDISGIFAWRHVVSIEKNPDYPDGCSIVLSTGTMVILSKNSCAEMIARYANAHCDNNPAFTLTGELTKFVAVTKTKVVNYE